MLLLSLWLQCIAVHITGIIRLVEALVIQCRHPGAEKIRLLAGTIKTVNPAGRKLTFGWRSFRDAIWTRLSLKAS